MWVSQEEKKLHLPKRSWYVITVLAHNLKYMYLPMSYPQFLFLFLSVVSSDDSHPIHFHDCKRAITTFKSENPAQERQITSKGKQQQCSVFITPTYLIASHSFSHNHPLILCRLVLLSFLLNYRKLLIFRNQRKMMQNLKKLCSSFSVKSSKGSLHSIKLTQSCI